MVTEPGDVSSAFVALVRMRKQIVESGEPVNGKEHLYAI